MNKNFSIIKKTIISIIIITAAVFMFSKYWITIETTKLKVNPDISAKQEKKYKKQRTITNFDFCALIIILIIAGILSRRFSRCIADSDTLKEKSAPDIILLMAFFIFLFIPISSINTDKVSKKEKRSLAPWKPLISQGKINYNFGNDYNRWFNDRFAFRHDFINIYYCLLSHFGHYCESKHVIYNRKADFSYNKYYGSVDRFLRKDLFTQKELNKINDNFSSLLKYCNQNNVKLFVMLSNDKESIYPEYYPEYYQPEKNISRLEQTKNLLKKIPGLNIISPQEALLKEKNNHMLFLNYDTHLNGLGTFIEYSELISNIKKVFPNIVPLKFSQTKIEKYDGQCDSLPPKKYITKDYEFPEKIEPVSKSAELIKKISVEGKSANIKQLKNTNTKNNLKAIIVGDSFHYQYLDLLSENFYMLNSLFVGDGLDFVLDDTMKKALFYEKPDIIIIESTERFLRRFLALDSFNDIFDPKYRSN